MAIVYSTALKNSRLQEVVSAIGSGGKLEICTAGYGAVLATIPLENPAGTVSGGILTFDTPVTDTSADATGTAALARIRTSADVDVVTGLTVGTSASDIMIATTAISAGLTVTIVSATITHG